MKRLFIIVINLLLVINLFSQYGEIKWLTMQEALKLQDSIPKTILIDMYTNWCGWCKKMDAETFHNPDIAAYVNQYFYPVKFNAECFDTIIYKGKTYTNSGSGNRSTHDLAIELLYGRLSYPTIVYIDSDGKVNPVPGYMGVNDIEAILVYFSENINKVSDYASYLQDFNNTFHPETTATTNGTINWVTLDDAINKQKENSKKLLIYIASDFLQTSKIMLASVLRNPVISDYINKNFYPVKINYDCPDTINFHGYKFINEQKIPGYPNQFAISLLQPDGKIPAMVIFDENLNFMYAQKGYGPAAFLERLLTYFNEGFFKNGVDWQKFNEDFKSNLQETEKK